jgi:hypothetical protein
VTLLVDGQSAAVQQFVPLMQSFWLVQAFSPLGQLHEPPGPEHVSPTIAQSAFVQHAAIGMHELLSVQNFWPAGQLHDPPGPEQLAPPVQSEFVQQAACAMHWLKPTVVQTFPPLAHAQLPPGPVQAWPLTRQSALVQQVVFAMHELLTVHTLSLAPQLHVPPGDGQLEPVMLLQSVLVQQFPVAMQALFAVQAW